MAAHVFEACLTCLQESDCCYSDTSWHMCLVTVVTVILAGTCV